MSRAVLIIDSQSNRLKALAWVNKAPNGTRLEFMEAKRSLPQNDRMWAMLTEVAAQKVWHGVKLSADDWKLIFMAGLNQEMRLVPNLDGNGFVNLGRSSSKLSKDEMTQLIELIHAWGAQNGVTFSDRQEAA